MSCGFPAVGRTRRAMVRLLLVALGAGILVHGAVSALAAATQLSHAAYTGSAATYCDSDSCSVDFRSSTCVETALNTSVVLGTSCVVAGTATFKRTLTIEQVNGSYVIGWHCTSGTVTVTFTSSVGGRTYGGSGRATLPGFAQYAGQGQPDKSHKTHFAWAATGPGTPSFFAHGHAILNGCATDGARATLAGTAASVANG